MERKKVWHLGDVQWSGTSFSANAPVKTTKPIIVVTRLFLSASVDN